jgi:ribosome biogenesis GTPase A
MTGTIQMLIQWYPGHMHKAGKEIKQTLADIDLIIEILDARIPFSSENPKLAQLRGDKPCIKLLNKSDLADPQITRLWQDYLEQQRDIKTLAISMVDNDRIQAIFSLCRKMIPHKTDRNIHALIMGIPNVGKSTLINQLAGRIIAKTGNEPAITKAIQRIDLKNDITLFDTPGMLWPNLENKNSGYRLATTGAIRDTAISHDDIAYFAAEYLLQTYPEQLKTRFQLEDVPPREKELLEMIGRKRGCLKTGGVVDMDRIAKIFLTELRAGTIGRISLETPEMAEQELAELAIIRQEKAAKKAARKDDWKKHRTS